MVGPQDPCADTGQKVPLGRQPGTAECGGMRPPLPTHRWTEALAAIDAVAVPGAPLPRDVLEHVATVLDRSPDTVERRYRRSRRRAGRRREPESEASARDTPAIAHDQPDERRRR
jgi:hypothetical protein